MIPLRLSKLRDGLVPLSFPLFCLYRSVCVLMELPHQHRNLTIAIVSEQILVEQRVLLAIVKLQPAFRLAIHD